MDPKTQTIETFDILREQREIVNIPAMTPQQARITQSAGLLAYRELMVGKKGWFALAHYELCMLVSGFPGLMGYGLRTLLYPSLFESCGRKIGIGKGVVFRNITQAKLGSRVLFDDYSGLDCRGESASIQIGNCVSVGRFSSLVARNGEIVLHDGVNIGAYTRIGSGSKVEIGASTLIAAYCYIGPGNHLEGNADQALIEREMDNRGGVDIGEHAWIGTRTTIVDGVSIGHHAIIGAHSLVNKSIPPGAVAYGSPAKVVRYIDGFNAPEECVPDKQSKTASNSCPH